MFRRYTEKTERRRWLCGDAVVMVAVGMRVVVMVVVMMVIVVEAKEGAAVEVVVAVEWRWWY